MCDKREEGVLKLKRAMENTQRTEENKRLDADFVRQLGRMYSCQFPNYMLKSLSRYTPTPFQEDLWMTKISAWKLLLVATGQTYPETFCQHGRLFKTTFTSFGNGIIGKLYRDRENNIFKYLLLDMFNENVILDKIDILEAMDELQGNQFTQRLTQGTENFTSNFLQFSQFIFIRDCFNTFLPGQCWSPCYQLIMTSTEKGTSLDHIPKEVLSYEVIISILSQILLSLEAASGVNTLEYVNLQTSSILIKETAEKVIPYVIRGEKINLPSHKFKVILVDFRMKPRGFQVPTTSNERYLTTIKYIGYDMVSKYLSRDSREGLSERLFQDWLERAYEFTNLMDYFRKVLQPRI